jgi:hypothetical protein
MKMTAFWDIAPCSLVEVDRRSRDAYCLHHEGDISSIIALTMETVSTYKSLLTSTRLHGALSQKAVIFKTANFLDIAHCTNLNKTTFLKKNVSVPISVAVLSIWPE